MSMRDLMADKRYKGVYVLIMGVVLLIVGVVAAEIAGTVGYYIIGNLNNTKTGITVPSNVNWLGQITGIIGPIFTILGVVFIVLAAVLIIRELFNSFGSVTTEE